MLIKSRFKLIRKFDCDFWHLTYWSLEKNKFFNYVELSLIKKIKNLTRVKQIKFKNRFSKLVVVHLRGKSTAKGRVYNPFLNKITRNFLKIFKKFKRFGRRLINRKNFMRKYRRSINFFSLFKKMTFGKVSYYYRKGCYKKKAFKKSDILLGTKKSFTFFKPIKRTEFLRKKFFFKQITLYYNNFDFIKLKRFGLLGRKGQFGGINYFFLLLESRIDSILLRLNFGSKFLMRSFILSKIVLVDKKPISYFNYIVKRNQFINFSFKTQSILYKLLKKNIRRKIFYVQPPFYFEINYRTLTVLLVPKLINPSFIPYPFIRVKSKLISGLHTVLWGW